MDESQGEGKARRAFGRSSEARKTSTSAPSAVPRRDPASVKDALDRMAAGIGERKRARDELLRRREAEEPDRA